MATKNKTTAKGSTKKADPKAKAAEFKATVKEVIEEIFAEQQEEMEAAAVDATPPSPVKPEDWFRFYKFTEEDQKLSEEITAKAVDLVKSFEKLPYFGNGRFHATDKVREAVMWANRAIADNHIS